MANLLVILASIGKREVHFTSEMASTNEYLSFNGKFVIDFSL